MDGGGEVERIAVTYVCIQYIECLKKGWVRKYTIHF